MRVREIVNEIHMAPTRLAQAASVTNAIAGMEFEMCVPGVSPHAGSIDFRYTPDFTEDESVTSFDRIYLFFMKNGANRRSVIDNVVNDLEEEFHDWKSISVREKWESEKAIYIGTQLTDEEYFDPFASDDEINKIVNNFEEYDKDTYEELKDRFIDEKEDQFTERMWFEETELTMKELFDNNDLEWPYQTEEEIISDSEYRYDEYDMDQLGEQFSQMIGKEVNVGYRYHGATRRDNEYSLEPDGSVEDEHDDSLAGLEFISPAMPLSDMIVDLTKVVKWAKKYGCKTNKSTGLHMNVSIPNTTGDSLDYVKLALLLGDTYILETFSRWGNEYCKPVLDKLQKTLLNSPNNAALALEKLKEYAIQEASELIHRKFTEKKVSINIKNAGSYIEIRSPGGDWLNTDISTLVATLNRIAVAIDAAYDPNKYRSEYLKKFYKLLTPGEPNEVIDLFVKFSAGELTIDQLKNNWTTLITNNSRVSSRREALVGKHKKLFWWNVKKNGESFNALVRGFTRQEAINNAVVEWPFNIGSAYNVMVTQLEECDDIPNDGTDKMWSVISHDNSFRMDHVHGQNEEQAMRNAYIANMTKFNSGFSGVYLEN